MEQNLRNNSLYNRLDVNDKYKNNHPKQINLKPMQMMQYFYREYSKTINNDQNYV